MKTDICHLINYDGHRKVFLKKYTVNLCNNYQKKIFKTCLTEKNFVILHSQIL